MKELGITQKFLAEATGMSEAKISRIMRDSTEPGDSFEWTELDINKISIVLQWGSKDGTSCAMPSIPNWPVTMRHWKTEKALFA